MTGSLKTVQQAISEFYGNGNALYIRPLPNNTLSDGESYIQTEHIEDEVLEVTSLEELEENEQTKDLISIDVVYKGSFQCRMIVPVTELYTRKNDCMVAMRNQIKENQLKNEIRTRLYANPESYLYNYIIFGAMSKLEEEVVQEYCVAYMNLPRSEGKPLIKEQETDSIRVADLQSLGYY